MSETVLKNDAARRNIVVYFSAPCGASHRLATLARCVGDTVNVVNANILCPFADNCKFFISTGRKLVCLPGARLRQRIQLFF